MEVLIFLLLIAAVIWAVRRSRKPKPTQPGVAPSQPASKEASRTVAPVPRTETTNARPAGAGMRFAEPGRTGSLFSYGGPSRGRGYVHDGPFAVIDVETTGFSPGKGDRIIELAIARVDRNGRVEDEYATLLNPEGRDTGAVFVHGINNDAVRQAPLFSDVIGDVLARLEGTVVVAHNAVFEERFLAAELERAGIATPYFPALCSLWLGQQTFDTPNHKLGTLAQHAGIPLHDAHAALGDVRATAALLPLMLDRFGSGLEFGHGPASGLSNPYRLGAVSPVTRAVSMRKGSDGWMASLMSRLPMSTEDVSDATAAAYLEAVASALEDGKIVGEEAKMLARIAGNGGMGAAQVRGLNERFLEMMREAALADHILTSTELADLNRAALALSSPDYFDDLAATASEAKSAGTQLTPGLTNPTRAPRKCGHCRTPGHYRSNCPDLN